MNQCPGKTFFCCKLKVLHDTTVYINSIFNINVYLVTLILVDQLSHIYFHNKPITLKYFVFLLALSGFEMQSYLNEPLFLNACSNYSPRRLGRLEHVGYVLAPPVASASGVETAPVTVPGQARTGITVLVIVSIKIFAWNSSVCIPVLLCM